MRRFAFALVFGFTIGLLPFSTGLPQEGLEAPSRDQESTLPEPSTSANVSVLKKNSGYLGLVANDELNRGRGIRITSVRVDGPAYDAGIKLGDLIRRVNGLPIENLNDMARTLQGLTAGAEIHVELEREGQRESVNVVLAERRPNVAGRWITVQALLGVRVVTLSERIRRERQIPPRSGALVIQIEPGSPADKEGLLMGAVIVAVDSVRIETSDDLIDLVSRAEPGKTVEVSYYVGEQMYRKAYRLAPLLAVTTGQTNVRTNRDGAHVANRLIMLDPPLAAPEGPIVPFEARSETDAPDLILPSPIADIDMLRRTVDRLERHVQALQV